MTLMQLLNSRLWYSWADLKHDFSGSLLPAGVSDLLTFDGWDCWSDSTSKDVTGCSSLTQEMVVSGDISSTAELSTSWIPNSQQPVLVSCFLSLCSLSAPKESVWCSDVIGRHMGMLAADDLLLTLNSIKPGLDADKNWDVGQDDVCSFVPLCKPETENVLVLSAGDFHKPATAWELIKKCWKTN